MTKVMTFSNIYKLINTVLLLLIFLLLIPLFFSSGTNISTYKGIYIKLISSLNGEINYNMIIDTDNLNVLKSGNNTVFLRHGHDDMKNREYYFDALSVNADYDPIGLESTSKLTQKGIYQSEVLASFFQNNNITFEEVWSSPISRCVETAEYFSDEVNSPDWLFLNGFTNTREAEIQKFKNLFFKRIKDKNILIVGHGSTTGHIGIPSDLEKSDFLVYNHDTEKVILHGSLQSIVNSHHF